MTDIEPRQEPATQEVEQYAPISKLGRWAQDARDAHLVAQSLAKTVFVPREMQGKPELVTAAILTGTEMGLQPMASLRSIDVIQGTPAMRAHALRGLVQAAGHEVWVDESTDTRAIVCGQRSGSEKVQRSVWTIDRAQKLGLTARDQWRKQPQAMLIARATAEVCRLIASDVLLGMPYAVEELDEPDVARPRKPVKRKPVERIEPAEPPLEPEQPAVRADEEPPFDEDTARAEDLKAGWAEDGVS